MPENKKQVTIEFISTGLKEIQSQLEKAIPFLTKKTSKDAFSTLANQIQTLFKTISGSSEWSTEGVKLLGKEFSSVITKFSNLKVELYKFTSEDLSLKIEELNGKLALIEKETGAKERELRNRQKNVWQNDEGTTVTSKKFSAEVFETGQYGGLSPTGLPTQKYDTFLKTIKSIEEAAKTVGYDLGANAKNTNDIVLKFEEILNKQGLTLTQAKEQLQVQSNLNSAVTEVAKGELEAQEKLKIEIEEKGKLAEKVQDEIKKTDEEFAKTGEGSGDLGKEIQNLAVAITQLSSDLKLGLNRNIGSLTDEQIKAIQAAEESAKAHDNLTPKVKEASTTFGQAAKNVFSYGTAFQFLKRIYRETIRTITELDKSLTDMAIVTDMNRKEAWALIPTLQDLAKETGFTTTEVAALTTEYLKQGKSLQDALVLSEAAAKAAKIAGISASESVKYLTAALNGFSLAADKAMEVSDKFAALAASSATDYEQLAVGLSKFASQANLAGLSIDFALGMLAKGVETTQEAPESIGTALKTVLARMRELTDYGKTLEDGMNVNRVETALEQIGVKLRDVNGSFRDMESVLTEVGSRWETLNTNQQAAVAVAMAGTRQQSRLIAIFQDFDRTLQLVQESQDSVGATNAQHVEYMESMAAAMTRLQTAWQGFITTITDSETIIDIVRGIASAIEWLSTALDKSGVSGKNAMIVMALMVIALKTKTIWTTISTIATKLATKADLESAGAEKIKIEVAEEGIKKTKLQIFWENIKTIFTKKGMIAALKAIVVNIAYAASMMLIAAGIAVVVAGVVWLIKQIVKSTESFEKHKQKVAADNYELQKTNKSMKELIDNYDELNSKAIKTDEDVNQLKNLEEQLLSLENGKYVVKNVLGEIDWEASIIALNKAIKNNSEEIITNLAGLMDEAWQKFQRGAGTKTDAMDAAVATMIANYEYLTQFNIKKQDEKSLSTYLIAEFESSAEALDEVNGKFEKFQTWFAKNDVSNKIKNYLGELEGWEKSISFGDTLQDQFKKYKEIRDGLTDPEMIAAIDKQYQTLSYILQNFSSEINNSGFFETMENLGYTVSNFNDLTTEANEAGYDFNTLLVGVGKQVSIIMEKDGVSAAEATAIAWTKLAMVINDATFQAELFNLAMGNGTLNTAQSIDSINSSIKNIAETRDKYLKGELSDEEFYNFVNDHPDLFADQNFVNAFNQGQDLTRFLVEELISKEDEYRAQLNVWQGKLSKARTQADKDAAIMEINRLKMLLAYDGIYKNLTSSQIRYNSILAQYNKLTELGIEDNKLKAQSIELLTQVTAQTMQENAQKIEDLNNTYSDVAGVFKVVNGVVIVDNWDLYNELLENGNEYLDSYQTQLQEYTDATLTAFNQWKKIWIEDKQKEIDKSIDTYKKYFENLDRIEQKDARKKDRDSIVKQIQRLEGATDEKSRQKALELKKELISLDEEAANDERKEARDALIESLETSKKELTSYWNDVATNIVSAMANGGREAAKNYLYGLKAAGQLTDQQYKSAINSLNQGNVINERDNNTGTTTSLTNPYKWWQFFKYNEWERENNSYHNIAGSAWRVDQENDFREEKEEELAIEMEEIRTKFEPKINYINMMLSNGGYDSNVTREELYSWLNDNRNLWEEKFPYIPFDDWEEPMLNDGIIKIVNYEDNIDDIFKGFRKGGLVDYTGPALVHGTSTNPEAFLNADQTALFANLRDVLSSMAVGSGTSAPITIENITIQTTQLNNNQDFKSAGNALAEAFSSAINRRGLNLNTKR